MRGRAATQFSGFQAESPVEMLIGHSAIHRRGMMASTLMHPYAPRDGARLP